jgi:hypothetical protein
MADDSTELDDYVYEAVTCLACARIHMINPKSGKVLGGDSK